jgi:hypothetical protein
LLDALARLPKLPRRRLLVAILAVGVVVELDGRLGHEATTDRWNDLERDLDAVVQGDLTVRAGWGLVLDPCRLAAALVRILLARGWTGRPRGAGRDVPSREFS